MRFFLKYFPAVFAALLCCLQLDAQQRVRIAGLEQNERYSALAAEEAALSRTADSITESMNAIRRSFRTDTLNRAANSIAILRMEEESFDLRNRIARVAGQINAIEQEWIHKSLYAEETTEATAATEANAPKERVSANLVYNSYFDRNLNAQDLSDLRAAQRAEAEIPPLIKQYRENNDRLRLLKYAYDLALMEGTADSIKMRFDSLALVNTGLERRIADTWVTIFDNKSYCYNFVMDKNNRNDLLARYESDLELLRQEQARLHGRYASDEIVNWTLQKHLLTGYEIKMAEYLSYKTAADSLKKAQSDIPRIETLDLEPVKLKERLFLDYADIKINASSPYNSRNPIPEVKVYPKGIIYRVLLGTYSATQTPSAFRNVSPLAVQKGPDNKFRYFAGGFPTDSAANDAVLQMKKRGFKNPEAVVWMDGVYMNLATGKGFGSGFYRVEISGVNELPAEVREVIRTATSGKDIVRGEGMFIVGPLDNAAEAARLRSTLEGRLPDMEVEILEIAN